MVLHLFILIQTLASRQTRVPRSTAVSELGKVAEPGVAELPLFARLRIVPIKISYIHITFRLSSDASHRATCHTHQHATCSEERHLRVIADQSLSFAVEFKLRDAVVAVSRKDFVASHELHGVAQRIAGGARHQ